MKGEFEAKVESKCPCGGKATAGYGTTPDGTKNVPSVLHTWPPCQKYIDLEVNDYLEYIRKAQEN